VAWTARGVCHFAFRSADDAAMLAELRSLWPAATLARDDARAHALMQQIFPRTPTRGSVHLVLRGTNFQIKVWEALIRIEPGRVLSYAQLARALGMPRAPRTVGSAIAANTIGYLIPCHRVIRAGGEVGDYRWGSERKLALLGHEAAQHGG
jgi:AraC family transcriptional regulator of adaptative response/methylated-DNA-[protein]-cysteine methyltransferase